MADAFPLDLIMLVDDDPDENFVNARTLRRAEMAHRVIAFENPLEGIAYLENPESAPVDVIVLDINMPEISGFEFLERHNLLPTARQARAVIMLLTTSLNPKDMERASVYADTVYQNKPLRPEMIVEAVRTAEKPHGNGTVPTSERGH